MTSLIQLTVGSQSNEKTDNQFFSSSFAVLVFKIMLLIDMLKCLKYIRRIDKTAMRLIILLTIVN